MFTLMDLDGVIGFISRQGTADSGLGRVARPGQQDFKVRGVTDVI